MYVCMIFLFSYLGEFKKMSMATCLNISNNNIAEISNRCFVNLFNLSMLDMSHNNLLEIPNFNGKGKDLYLNFKGTFVLFVCII